MVPYQPADGLGLFLGQTEPGTQREGYIGTQFGVIPAPPFRNIMKQDRRVQRAP